MLLKHKKKDEGKWEKKNDDINLAQFFTVLAYRNSNI